MTTAPLQTSLTQRGAYLALALLLLTACEASITSVTPMQITSDDFSDGSSIPSEFTCDGHDIRPDIRIAGVPAGTKSLAIIMHDPDAPSGEFIHWAAWNIDPSTTSIAGTDSLPGATEGPNGAGNPGYKGPCPPTGTHHYVFTVYAVSKMLTLPTTATAAELRDALAGNTVGEATLTGLYEKMGASSSDSSLSEGELKTEPGATIPPQY